MWSTVTKGQLVLGFLILPRESLAAFFTVVGMALVISLSVFASVTLALLVTPWMYPWRWLPRVKVVNTRVLRKDWGLTLKPSAGTNDSSKGVDLKSVQACQMCLDLPLPQPGRCFCSQSVACAAFVPVAPAWWWQPAGLASCRWARYGSCLPALPAPAGTEGLTLGCLLLEHGLKVAKLHHVPDFNTWLFNCWKK